MEEPHFSVVELLRGIEWMGNTLTGERTCPACRAFQTHGHAASCELACRLLAASPASEPDLFAKMRAAKYLNPECLESGCQWLAERPSAAPVSDLERLKQAITPTHEKDWTVEEIAHLAEAHRSDSETADEHSSGDSYGMTVDWDAVTLARRTAAPVSEAPAQERDIISKAVVVDEAAGTFTATIVKRIRYGTEEELAAAPVSEALVSGWLSVDIRYGPTVHHHAEGPMGLYPFGVDEFVGAVQRALQVHEKVALQQSER